MTRNRYLDRRSGRNDYARGRGRDRAMDSELQERYDAKREEIARHRDYMHNLQMQMQPYRRINQDRTEFEYQSAFEIPGEDYARRGSNQYEMKYDRRSDYARGQGNSNSNRRDYAPYDEEYYYPPLAPQDYARGRGRSNYDYNYDYARSGRRNDYNDYDSGKEWKKDLEKFTEKLKKKDRFHIKMEDVITSAKQMGVKFDDFTEEEFYAVYLMEVSDHPQAYNDFRSYLARAKEWLEDDDDIEVSPSEKLCIYYYEIVKGEGMDD